MTELVVLGALIFIGKDLIGLTDFFKTGFRRFVVRIQIGVVFLGKLAVGFFQLAVARPFGNTQDFVIISFLTCHMFHLS
ncbi:hypothetical protein SDC9_123227 [bioreactor metagenome]|uniref:Uncharacterized protein n=1 Tax=bioreactor metagenome TaxID=1076179 RepID=A0A645CH08_9ZZZZ